MSATISVSAVALLDDLDRILLVRKRGTSRFMQPGGKPELGESPLQTALRELDEELGLRFDAGDLEPRGLWVGSAANEPGTELHAHLFEARLRDASVPGRAAAAAAEEPMAADDVVARAEIAELVWAHPRQALERADLAPLLREEVLPGLLRAGHAGGAAPAPQ